MATIFSDVIEEVISNLQAYTASPDQITSLTGQAYAADLTISVQDASVLSRGIIEIDTELLWIQSSDPATNTFQVLPMGRGWRGSQAADHVAGSTVTATPAIPRFIVRRELVNAINGIYPEMYAVNTTEFTYSNILQIGWPLPADAMGVLDVRWLDYNSNWQRIRTWEIEFGPATTSFPAGRSLRFHGIPQGRTVQVIYPTMPIAPTTDTALWSSTGLSQGAKDLVVLGTQARIAPNLDIARLNVAYATAEEMSQSRPPGSAMAVAKYLEAKYAQRLMQERQILNSQYPARIHFTR